MFLIPLSYFVIFGVFVLSLTTVSTPSLIGMVLAVLAPFDAFNNNPPKALKATMNFAEQNSKLIS